MRSSFSHIVVVLAPLIDGSLVALAGWVAYQLRWDSWQMSVDYLLVLLFATALVLVVFPLSGAYQSWRGRIQVAEFGHVVVGLLGVAIILVVAGTLTKTSADFSRLWMSYWFALALLLLYFSRLFLLYAEYHWIRPRVKSKHILIVGTGKLARTTARHIGDAGWPPMQVAGFIASKESASQHDLPAPLLGIVPDLDRLLGDATVNIDEVWLALSPDDHEEAEALIEKMRRSCLTVRYVPDLSTLQLLHHLPTEIAGLTVIDLNAAPLTGPNLMLKIAFDKLFALAVLVTLAPLMLLIALAVKLDSTGSVLYRQTRHGWDGKPIKIIKFRTMVESAGQESQYQQASRQDSRITRVGKLLRRSSLDELPQFLNVLAGDMSVVGPRPHPIALNENFVEHIEAYMQRHRVKPGITGWAQVNGYRGETDTLDKMQKRVDADLYYIEHWSLWLDVKIILRTVTMGWMGKNAY